MWLPAFVSLSMKDDGLCSRAMYILWRGRSFEVAGAPADLPMDRMLLVLKRSPEQEAALLKLLDDQQDKSSPRLPQMGDSGTVWKAVWPGRLRYPHHHLMA